MSKFLINSLATMKGKQQDDSKDRDQITVDLTLEILSRLPLKSILMFQVVSKTWRSIIRSKDFINFSVSMSSTPSPQLLISFKNGELTNKNAEKCLFFFTSSHVEDESSSSSTLVANLHMTLTSKEAHFYTPCASINGFICLSYKGRFMICNPSTRQVITLPEITGGFTNRYLGYDPVGDQYKAMCKRVSNSKEDQEHMVLTLGGGKKPTWRHIKGTTKNYLPFTKGICINGLVYYGAFTPTPYMDRMIVCFDVRSERISFIKPPNFIGVLEPIKATLINYKGKLAIVDFHYLCDFQLCVLEDVKKHEWLKITCSVSNWGVYAWWDPRDIPRCHGTTKTGEIVISPMFLPLDRTFYIFYCDVENRNVRRVQLEGLADDKEFRCRYGIGNNGNCYVYISPEHCVNFTFL